MDSLNRLLYFLLNGVHRWSRTRVVFCLSILMGMLSVIYFLTLSNSLSGDFYNYYQGATAAMNDQPVYLGQGGSFVYPPVMTAVFFPFTLINSWKLAFGFYTVVNVGVGVSIGIVTIRFLREKSVSLGKTDTILLLSFPILSTPAISTILLGQINLWIVLLLAVGFVALESDQQRLGGISLGVAAIPKLFPAIVGLYLLRERYWRAIISAVVAGVGGLVVGVILYGPSMTRNFVRFLGEGGIKTDFLQTGQVPPADLKILSIARPLSVLVPDLTIAPYLIIASTFSAVFLGIIYWSTDTAEDRLMAFLGTVITAILVFPPEFAYSVLVFFPLLPLLYLVEDQTTHRLLSIGTILLNMMVTPGQLETALHAISIPEADTAFVLTALRSVLYVASLPLLGLLFLVAACIHYSYKQWSRPVK